MALTTTTSETMTDSSITMMTALDDLSSVVAALPVAESAEAPGDLASHGERATTLATQVSEKVTTQVSEKVTTQVSEKVTLATIPASEKAMDTEWQRKPTFLSQFSRNPVASNQSVSIIFTNATGIKLCFCFENDTCQIIYCLIITPQYRHCLNPYVASANSADQYQTAHNATSDQSFHCLLRGLSFKSV